MDRVYSRAFHANARMVVRRYASRWMNSSTRSRRYRIAAIPKITVQKHEKRTCRISQRSTEISEHSISQSTPIFASYRYSYITRSGEDIVLRLQSSYSSFARYSCFLRTFRNVDSDARFENQGLHECVGGALAANVTQFDVKKIHNCSAYTSTPTQHGS